MYNYIRETGHGVIGKNVMEWAMLALQIKKRLCHTVANVFKIPIEKKILL